MQCLLKFKYCDEQKKLLVDWVTGDTLIYLDGYFATINESYSTEKLIIEGVQEWYGFFFTFT